MLDTLDAAAVRRWCDGGLAALRAHQHEIDELNVYPVPDGDTGTNLVLTLTSAHQALDGPPDAEPAVVGSSPAAPPGSVDDPPRTPLGRALRLMARGALLGARGNSGVIVSQILRGMADALSCVVAVRGDELARALRSATDAAYAAVAKPVEGTVLSVVAAAADGAARIGSDDLLAVARAAAAAATEALARTPQQLPVLARAGVVDAGGRGLCLLLDALVGALDGTVAAADRALPTGPAPGPVAASADWPPGAPPLAAPADWPPGAPPLAARPAAEPAHAQAGTRGFEVQYLLDAEPAAVRVLRDALATFGESLVVVGTGDGDPPTWNVHVHVDDIGAAIEAGVVAGRPHRITVTPLTSRHHHHGDDSADRAAAPPRGAGIRGAGVRGAGVRGAQPGGGHGGDIPGPRLGQLPIGPGAQTAGPPAGEQTAGAAMDPRARAAVVVAAGDGLTALFVAEGATVVGRNPSTAEVLAAVASTGAGRVVLLPNDANTHAVATSAAREAAALGVRVSVVPTRSPVQALAALAVRDPERPFSDDVIAMAEAAGACRYGEVCTASREALTVAGRCRPGDLLGMVDGEVHVIGADLEDVCRRLLDRMLGGGGELVTLVLGADAPAALEGTLQGHVSQAWPFVELQCYAGGQPRYHLLVGVE